MDSQLSRFQGPIGVRGGGVLLSLLLLSACRDDLPQQVAEPNVIDERASLVSAEEELFGSIWDGSGKSQDPHTITLTPMNGIWGEPGNHLALPSNPGGFQSTIQATTAYGNRRMYGWFDPIASGDGGRCSADPNLGRIALLDAYLGRNGASRNAATNAEVHPAGSALERHCIRPGQYLIAGPSAPPFVVDYLALESVNGVMIPITNTEINNTTEGLEADTYDENDKWWDLAVNFHLNPTTTYSDIPDLDIQNALSNRALGTFTNAPLPQGSASDWFRFSVRGTSSTWDLDNGHYLARIFYDFGKDDNVRTGFWDPETGVGIRAHQFFSHVSSSRCVSVGLEVMRPDEVPVDLSTHPQAAVLVRQIGIGMTCLAGRDLVPVRVTSSSPVVAGQTINVSVRTQNQGRTNVTGTWRGQIWLSANTTIGSGDVLLNASPSGNSYYTVTQPIDSGTSRDAAAVFTIPAGTAVGPYYIITRVNSDSAIAEAAGHASNDLATLIQVIAPDLNAINLSGTPPTIAPGGSLTVNVTMRNLGNAAAPGGWGWRVYLSTDQTLSPGTDVLLKAWGFGPLPAGGSGGFSQAVNLPGSLPNGTYYLIAQLDVTAAVAESNENNNVTVSASPITVQPGLP